MSRLKCAAGATLKLTQAVEEGPYYKPGSPERGSIAGAGTAGLKLVLEGRVLDRDGHAVNHAWLDFWNADGNGQYDNAAYNLRGHQYTDKNGRYCLETVRPVQYLSRAPHIHAKVRANAGSPTLTTQLFSPGEKRNKTDALFRKETVMEVVKEGDIQKAVFDFVVETG